MCFHSGQCIIFRERKEEAVTFIEHLLSAKCLRLGIKCLSSLNPNTYKIDIITFLKMKLRLKHVKELFT